MIDENSTEKQIQQEVFENRNRLVISIDDNHVCRLLGWTDEQEEDYYWIVAKWGNPIDGPEIHLETCVGSPTWLYGILDEKSYGRIDNSWNINNHSAEDCINVAQKKGIKIK
jgi:hypothetical protein